MKKTLTIWKHRKHVITWYNTSPSENNSLGRYQPDNCILGEWHRWYKKQAMLLLYTTTIIDLIVEQLCYTVTVNL